MDNLIKYCETLNGNDFIKFEKSNKSLSMYLTIYDGNDFYSRVKIAQLRFSDHNHPVNGNGYLNFVYWNNLSFEDFKKEVKEYCLNNYDNCKYYGNLEKEEISKLLNFILDELDIETASKLIPKLFSSLGDIYEEK